MRTTVGIEDALLREAARLSGISDPTVLVEKALDILIERESARGLARLGGTEPNMKKIPRRRSLGKQKPDAASIRGISKPYPEDYLKTERDSW